MLLRLTAILITFAACAVDPLPPEVLRPEVPAEIAVPEGHEVAFVGQATGVQIYECAPDASATAMAWRLRAPRADLFEDGEPFATHFGGVDAGAAPGPYWKSIRDGSSVRGGNPISSPNPGNIPLLRLEAVAVDGDGIFSRVTFIHRLATVGGVGPSGACAGAESRMEMPYTSDYYFYVPSEP